MEAESNDAITSHALVHDLPPSRMAFALRMRSMTLSDLGPEGIGTGRGDGFESISGPASASRSGTPMPKRSVFGVRSKC